MFRGADIIAAVLGSGGCVCKVARRDASGECGVAWRGMAWRGSGGQASPAPCTQPRLRNGHALGVGLGAALCLRGIASYCIVAERSGAYLSYA